MVKESLQAAESLEKSGIKAEVIDLRSLKPLDEPLLSNSLKKTGRMVIADGGWQRCGVAAELSALAVERNYQYLRAPIIRVALPNIPAPASSVLENGYYPRADNIVTAVKQVLT
jgi:pyruvate dehydrogenase E1 component beta subunit